MIYKIQFKRSTAVNWSAVNPVLAAGEAGFAIDVPGLKIGDGVSSWNSLSYVTGITQSNADLRYAPIASKWLANTVYKADQLIYNGTTLYKVNANFTSPATFNATGLTSIGGGSGDVVAANNLSDLASASTARTNLGLGTAATTASTAYDAAGLAAAAQAASQPLDTDLTAIAALTTTSFGRSLLTQADAAASITTLALDSRYVPLTGVGSAVQAWDADLDLLAAVTVGASTFLGRKATGAVAAMTPAEALAVIQTAADARYAPTLTTYAGGNAGTTKTLVVANGYLQTFTLDQSACTFTMPSNAGGAQRFRVYLTQGTGGSKTATFTGVLWGSGTPPALSLAAGALDIIEFTTLGSSAAWTGDVVDYAYA